MSGALLGPEFGDAQIADHVDDNDIPYRRLEPERMIEDVVTALAAGKVVGWFQGRTEFGPRGPET